MTCNTVKMAKENNEKNQQTTLEDKSLKELVTKYLKSEKETISKLQTALGNKNFSLLISVGEQIYRQATSLGFVYISDIANSIKIASLRKDVSSVYFLIVSLKLYSKFQLNQPQESN